ncbi:Carbamoyl-phosphate synthase large chain, chloroplastic [Glycine soja]|uniref:Carbamoyl-phosphate synthase large chain, chloroplastic n=1 Tax=Glycine soja TaxID=3848 RepID=A0A445F5F6_GLYSO|nr:Carbamoyl-phosphate synthase large chain, chloroplastic [Glycine soja]
MDSRLYPQHNATSPFSPSLPFPFRSSKPLSQNNAVPATTLRPCPPPTTCLNPARVRCSNVAVAEPPAPKLGKWTDIKKILILGAGPIVIGKACEFDYSGTQACKALREEGNEVVLINSNPATIMTGPETVDRTYITPMTPDLVERSGTLEKYGVELIGAILDAIKKAEDRELFKQAMKNIGIKTPPSGIGTTLDECLSIANDIGEYPLIVRPAFTLGGTGGGISYSIEGLLEICEAGIAASLTNQVLIEKSLMGWKEYELEVMRDLTDNVVIICSIENIDPMGVHTGDSITVAPAQILMDKEYQRLRDYSIAIIREIGVECGGSNVQFAVNPENGEVMVIEMNSRVSRSSALIPRFAFENFPGSLPILTIQMKSVGEAMASIYAIYPAMKRGMQIDEIFELSYIDKWFLTQFKELVDVESFLLSNNFSDLTNIDFYEVKKRGFSDKQIVFATKSIEKEVHNKRLSLGVTPAYKRVDTCAAEFEANTPYIYSSYDFECESAPTTRKKVLILGGGPNRIGQGIEFDYCCCHASFALLIMTLVDRLYFKPLTVEDVLNIIDLERLHGIIVQLGGQTPLKLSFPLQQYLDEHKPACASGVGHIEHPKGGIARSETDAPATAADIGYPVVVRPSYVLGVEVDPEHPVLIDKYLSDACDIDVDALADSQGNVVIGGIMEHIEQAGIHSGDSACSIPTRTVPSSCLETIRSWTQNLVKQLNVRGLMNCQYAITPSGDVFLLEANPRASRTVPFVSKAIGHPLAKYASLVMSGKILYHLQFTKEVIPNYVSVKEAVLPFSKFPGCDVFLIPEMRSTGEVMGIDPSYNIAFAKAQIAAGQKLPLVGTVFLSLSDLTKPHLEKIAIAFVENGFKIVATSGTAHVL